jgi:hypothetical protein
MLLGSKGQNAMDRIFFTMAVFGMGVLCGANVLLH